VKASEIAQLIGGQLEGGADPELSDLAPLDRAGPQQIAFLADHKYLQYLETAQAGAVLIAESLAMRGSTTLPRIVVKDVHRAVALLLQRFHPEKVQPPGIHHTAVLGRGVALGADVHIGPYAVLGEGVRVGARSFIGAQTVVGDDVVIGEDVTVHGSVTLYRRVQIGDRSIVHSGVRLGSDGYGYTQEGGAHRKVPQSGSCIIGKDVEIGANTTIDRGSVGNTEIGDGVKIDNLVHIGHNVRIGPHSLIIAQVGISGSATLGSRVTVAGQVGIVGHVQVVDNVVVAGGTAVWASILEPGVYSGRPARPHKEELKRQAAVGRMPKLMERLKRLEQIVMGRKDEGE